MRLMRLRWCSASTMPGDRGLARLRSRARPDGSTAAIAQVARHVTTAPKLTAPPDRLRPRRGPHPAAVAVLVLGLGITGTLSVLTFRGHHRNEQRLLSLQTRLVGAAVASQNPLYIEDHLGGAVRLAAATNGDIPTFRNAMTDSVSAKGPFVAASLWRAGAGAPQLVTEVGAAPLLSASAASVAALVRDAQARSTFLVRRLTGPRTLRIGYAASAKGPRGAFVAYAEQQLPASRRIRVPPSSPVAQLNFAVYLGRSQTAAALLEASTTASLPLRGTTWTTRIPFGDSVLTLATASRGSLSGSLGQVLPPAIAFGGLLLTAGAALLTEHLIRRRVNAERLSEEIGHLYLEQRSVAETLQNALLPQQMPVIPGMEIAVRYLPGAAGADIGGDWYDVVPLDDSRFVFVVGDVSGRGVRAASVMASLHYASRAYALEGHSPPVILRQLARTLNVERDGHFATVLCGLVDVGAHRVVLANAGHLPPVLRRDGAAELLRTPPGVPIGVDGERSAEPATVTAPAGATLIAYTDGLVERRGEPLDDGMERLRNAASTDRPLEELLSTIVTDLTGDSPDDDIALIGLRWLN
jgi:serine phosphatase RsbU (regulator of sigma subunit)